MRYAELQVTTNFSFLHGGSHPEELAMQAAALGHTALAITDRNTLAGVVRAYACIKEKELPLKLLVGARLDLACGNSLLCLPTDRAAYGRLSLLLSLGRRRAPKGQCELHLSDLAASAEGQIAIALTNDGTSDEFLAHVAAIYPGSAYLAAQCLYRGDDERRLAALAARAERLNMPLAATNDVHCHAPERRPLQDVLTCIREHCTLDEAGFRLSANAERHLKPAAEMARLFRAYPEAVARTAEIADRIKFSLKELKYEYPVEPVPEGRTPHAELERLTWEKVPTRYPKGLSVKVRDLLDRELKLIAKLEYAPYFLTVYDIVRQAREWNILCQGRGSAANSAVCYVLGITAVDPDKTGLLFERFISSERKEPPDIDVDFEHERREEIIQYIYGKYGRDRAGLAATVISYRGRSAIREVGKVLGLSLDTVERLAKSVWGWESEGLEEKALEQSGFPLSPRGRGVRGEGPSSNKSEGRKSETLPAAHIVPAPSSPASSPPRGDGERLRLALKLARELVGFPRHLSQHVGGFVITKSALGAVVPIENAAMENRTVVEWDKDDLETLGLLKIDVLGLGMLTCLRKGFDLLRAHYGKPFDLATIPQDDPAVYDMLCLADSIGVFQVESRAQMSMLPRLKPRTYYDLVIEVAIVRPGPIQGDMVHPYLRNRDDPGSVVYPKPELAEVLKRTLGVPLFQEQAMQIAMVGAGFSGGKADKLRRAMATFRKMGTIHSFRQEFIDGMIANGYERDFAERCFKQIEGFGEYGFPESHAASFALLVYASAWMKCHYPAVFAAAILNSQPMGFYAPAQLVRDAREHGVEVHPVDVNASKWDNTLEPSANGWALRLGFRQAQGVREKEIEKLVAARGNGYPDPRTLWRRAGLMRKTLERLAEADAFAGMGLTRREALWAIRILGPAPLPLFAAAQEDEQSRDPAAALPRMTLGEEIVEDYSALRLSLKAHPMKLLRDSFQELGVTPNEPLVKIQNGKPVTVAGIVLVRQRPGTAKGVIFMTLEDETGICNVIIWRHVMERFRPVVMGARLILVKGRLQREGIVTHIVADRLEDLSWLLDTLALRDAPMPIPHARADEVTRPNGRDARDPGGRRKHKADILYPSRDFH